MLISYFIMNSYKAVKEKKLMTRKTARSKQSTEGYYFSRLMSRKRELSQQYLLGQGKKTKGTKTSFQSSRDEFTADRRGAQQDDSTGKLSRTSHVVSLTVPSLSGTAALMTKLNRDSSLSTRSATRSQSPLMIQINPSFS